MDFFRIIFIFVISGLLIGQAANSRGLPYRQRSMWVAAAAFAVLGIANLLPLLGVDVSEMMTFLVGIPLLMLIGSVVLFGLSWRAKEQRPGILEARQKIAEEIKRRQEQHEERNKS
jgi:MFS-type transporter involved in bile tolerance (Atg22 family)